MLGFDLVSIVFDYFMSGDDSLSIERKYLL